MNTFPSIAAWLVFGTAQPADARQTVHAIPFASFSHCERKIDGVLHEMIEGAAQIGPGRRAITVKPFCTSIAPSFWVEFGSATQ